MARMERRGLRALASASVVIFLVDAAASIPRGVQLMQSQRGPLGTYGMPPCKRCGGARLHSRDDLLGMDDGELTRMKDDISKEVADLEKDVTEQKKKHKAEIGKLTKRLNDMGAAYEKLGKDAIARTAQFTDYKAANGKKVDSALQSNEQMQMEIRKIHASMVELRKYLNPYVDKFVSGDCKCAKAKALLLRLQASLRSADVDSEGLGADDNRVQPHAQALLRRSAKMASPADPDKYKLVKAVQELEAKRAKLLQDEADDLTDFSQRQRTTLDRIDAARIKASLKANTEKSYEERDKSFKAALKASVGAAERYLGSAKTQLARLQANEKASMKLFAAFKAELQKCKCL